MRYELFIAVRYLLAGRKQAFISLISLISTLGVMVGVMALLIALALMTGLQGELRDRIVGSTAHVYVFKPTGGLLDYHAEIAKLKQVPRVIGAAPVVTGPGMISGANGNAFITIKGVDPKLESEVTQIGRSMQTGSLGALDSKDGLPGIVIGRELAQRLGTFVGDTVEIITPQGTVTPFGMAHTPRRFKVAGVFSVGLLEFDEAYGFVHLDVAMRLLDRERPEFIELRVDDLFAARDVAAAIPERLGDD